MTRDQALAVLRGAGFDPVPLDHEHRTSELYSGELWDPGHPLRDSADHAIEALSVPALIGLAASVLYVCSDPQSWDAFKHETRELYRVTRRRLN